MMRSIIKVLGVVVLTLVVSFLSASSSSAVDVLEFVDIPVAPPYQAAVEPLLVCRNGFMFGFHAMQRSALRKDGAHRWDVSFIKDDGNLLIKEYPLWLREADIPLKRDGMTYPYAGYYTLLWKETVPLAPLTTCYGGAKGGFCKNKLDIQDCRIDLGLVVDIAQIGWQDTTRVVTDSLVYEVRAYDPKVGTDNGDGVERVKMEIIDPATGAVAYAVDRSVALSAGNGATFCAFTKDCMPWVFTDHKYTWPGGEPVKNGAYLLRATASAHNGARKVVQTQIEIKSPNRYALQP